MSKQTGTFDMNRETISNDEASRVATDYITDISSGSGIWVTPEDAGPDNSGEPASTTNGIRIKDAIEFFLNGVSRIYLGFKNNIPFLRLGKEDESHVSIDSSSLNLIDKENNVYLDVKDLRHPIAGFAALIFEYNVDKDEFANNGYAITLPINCDFSLPWLIYEDGEDVTDQYIWNPMGSVSNVLTRATGFEEQTTVVKIQAESTDFRAKTFRFGTPNPQHLNQEGPLSSSFGTATLASGGSAQAEGYCTTASGTASHAEGRDVIASGNNSHAEGYHTIASGDSSHAEGYYVRFKAGTNYSYYYTTASGTASHAEGAGTLASGYAAHAEGLGNRTSAYNMDGQTTASGIASHAEGYITTASKHAAHAEGIKTVAGGEAAHAEGYYTIASGDSSHAEGLETVAGGEAAHAEGIETVAGGEAGHAQNLGTIASSDSQTAVGKYNIEDSDNKYAFIIGNGSSNSRSNALTVDWNGIPYHRNPSNNWGSIFDLIYPVGSIYMSVNDISPATLFGGSWTRIQTGRFLVAAGGGTNPTTDGSSDAANDGHAEWYGVGEKGGARQITLTAAQSGVPSHSHGVSRTIQHVNLNPYTGATFNNQFRCSSVSSGGRLFYHINYVETVTSGGNTAANASSAHENRPPYIAVYMWKRTA